MIRFNLEHPDEPLYLDASHARKTVGDDGTS
jgi:hypothetical protein